MRIDMSVSIVQVAIVVQLRAAIKSPPGSPKHAALVRKESSAEKLGGCQHVACFQCSFPSFSLVPPSPPTYFNPFSPLEKVGKSCLMNKKISYQKGETWNHFSQKRLLENSDSSEVSASIMSSGFRCGSESRVYKLLLQKRQYFLSKSNMNAMCLKHFHL